MSVTSGGSAVQPSAPTASDDLIVEEYKACRDLIKTNIDIIEKTEIYCVGAAAAVAVFCLSSPNDAVVKATACIPLLITMVGGLRYFALHSTIRILDDYLRDLESRNRPLNWATFYRSRSRFHLLNVARTTMWIVLVVLAGGFGWVAWHHGPYVEPTKTQAEIGTVKPKGDGT